MREAHDTHEKQVHVVCSHDCPDSCGVLVTVDAIGRATRMQGDPTHPVTRGFLCGKVAKYLDRVYSPHRLLYPMRRRRGVPKGPLPLAQEASAFERVSWDQALDTIAAKFHAISREFGPEAILPYSYAGTIAQLGYGSMDRRFFNRLGGSQLDRTICSTAGEAAMFAVYGRKLGIRMQDFAKARLIIAWGANIHGNNIHLWPFIEEARRDRARLIVIDPYKTRTAKLADWHIAIRPGTDVALALGMMHVIITEALHDADYVSAHTHGFQHLRERVQGYTPAKVAAWTGLTPEEIVKLAREYAAARPSAIRLNYGIQRNENGSTAARSVCMLPALTGAWKYLGGGLQFSTSGAFDFDQDRLRMPELAQASPIGRLGRTVNMVRLGHALTEMGNDGAEPPVKALLVYNSNPAAVAPNQTAVLQGMRRADIFTVVHEQMFNDTTDYADILLPATTFLEHKDVQGAYGHYYVQISDRAIEPLGEARSNVRFFGELAQRMGFDEPCFRETEDDIIDQALHSSSPWQSGITREQLVEHHRVELQFHRKANGHRDGADSKPEAESVPPFLPFSGEGWALTPTGKIEFYSEKLRAEGLDPLPAFIPPIESRHSPVASSYPLEMLARKADNYMNSTFANIPTHQRMEAGRIGTVEMHPSDAAPRGIATGDRVTVFNSRGSIALEAKVDGTVPPGVVSTRLSWNKLGESHKGVNVLTSERLTDLGGGPTFYSTLVEIRKVLRPPEAAV